MQYIGQPLLPCFLEIRDCSSSLSMQSFLHMVDARDSEGPEPAAMSGLVVRMSRWRTC